MGVYSYWRDAARPTKFVFLHGWCFIIYLLSLFWWSWYAVGLSVCATLLSLELTRRRVSLFAFLLMIRGVIIGRIRPVTERAVLRRRARN